MKNVYFHALREFFCAKLKSPETAGSMSIYLSAEDASNFQVWIEENFEKLNSSFSDDYQSAKLYYDFCTVEFKKGEDYNYCVTIS